MNNREEYFFKLGQISYYLAYQSKAKEKNFELVINIESATNLKDLKNKLLKQYNKYKHSILIGNENFRNAFSLILEEEFEDKKISVEDKSSYLLGVMKNNQFLKKKKEDDQDEK